MPLANRCCLPLSSARHQGVAMVDRQSAAELLAGVDLFRGLSKKELRAIAAMAKEMQFDEGQRVVAEGEEGGRFHLILEGKAKVTVGGRTRNTLGPGDYFGEISLIDGGPRSATVTAETDMVCYGLTFWEFRPLVERNSAIAWKLLQALAKRLRAAEPK